MLFIAYCKPEDGKQDPLFFISSFLLEENDIDIQGGFERIEKTASTWEGNFVPLALSTETGNIVTQRQEKNFVRIGILRNLKVTRSYAIKTQVKVG